MSDNAWPYLADQGLSQAKSDLEAMADRAISDEEATLIETAIDAINGLFELSKFRTGDPWTRYFDVERWDEA